MRFGGEQDHVLRTCLSCILYGPNIVGLLGRAIRQMQCHATGVDGRKVSVAGDEGDVFPGQCQFGTQITANGASADDGVFHDLELALHKRSKTKADALRQANALQFAGSALGQLLHKQNFLGYLESSHPGRDKELKFALRTLVPLVQDHHRRYFFAQAFVWRTKDHHLGDRHMVEQNLIDFPGADLLAASVDDFL